jgi:hypothetical protein
MNAATNDNATPFQDLQSVDNTLTHWGKDDGGIQTLRGGNSRITRPNSAEVASEILSVLIARSSEGENLAPLVPGDLGHDMCRCAKSIDPDALGVTSHFERAIAD